MDDQRWLVWSAGYDHLGLPLLSQSDRDVDILAMRVMDILLISTFFTR